MADRQHARRRRDRRAQPFEREARTDRLPTSQRGARAARAFRNEEVDGVLHDDFVTGLQQVGRNERDRVCRRVGGHDARCPDFARSLVLAEPSCDGFAELGHARRGPVAEMRGAQVVRNRFDGCWRRGEVRVRGGERDHIGRDCRPTQVEGALAENVEVGLAEHGRVRVASEE